MSHSTLSLPVPKGGPGLLERRAAAGAPVVVRHECRALSAGGTLG